MTDLTLSLNPLAFDDLVQIGRSMIPTLTNQWTDHNYHDPGIMLMELVAWIAEAQMFSMDRLRRDERSAYAHFLGVQPQGPRPASGLLWPADGAPSWPNGFVAKSGTPVSAGADVPTFCTTRDVQLTQAALVRVETLFSNGVSHDWTLVNAQQSATFLPFGNAADSETRLVLTFEWNPPANSSAAAAPLSLGWEIENSPVTAPTSPTAPALSVTLVDANGHRRLTGVTETTAGLLQSGVMLFSPGTIAPEQGRFRLVLRSATGGFKRPPRVQRIGLNVLPIVQSEQILEGPVPLGLVTPIPNQQYGLAQNGLMFTGNGANDVQVRIEENGNWVSWAFTADLTSSGPTDRHFELDTAKGVLTFGNGVNGMLVPTLAPIRVQYSVTSGVTGNVQSGLPWSLQGIPRDFGVNSEATAGGAAATTLDDLRDTARVNSSELRPLVTSEDVEEAAKSYADLGVSRALELAPDASHLPGLRVLVVAGSHDPDDTGTGVAESAEFLNAVQTRISPKLTLGQRIRVIGPSYVPVTITATLAACRNANPADVRANVIAMLQQRLAIVAGAGTTPWPFHRPVTLRTVEGWLRKVEGVAQVVTAEVDAGAFGATSLPSLQISDSDITVNRPSATRSTATPGGAA